MGPRACLIVKIHFWSKPRLATAALGFWMHLKSMHFHLFIHSF